MAIRAGDRRKTLQPYRIEKLSRNRVARFNPFQDGGIAVAGRRLHGGLCCPWGFKSPASLHWHAVSPEGQVITYRELYVTGKTSAWLAQRAVELTGNEHLRYRVGDPSCWDASRGPSMLSARQIQKGKAMQQIKNGHPLVAKIVNGKRIAVKPGAAQ